MKVVLELQDQPSNVRRITIRHDIVIGRGSDCNLRLSAPQVSRRHCFLRVGRDSVSVTDLDSINGTFIDGKRITAGKRCDIADGAQLALGPIRFIVHVRANTALTDSGALTVESSTGNETSGASSGEKYESIDDSTVDERSLPAKSKSPMNFAVEQGSDSADPHETTAEELESQSLKADAAQIYSSDFDPADSRLEIIDFGRRLSEEVQTTNETRAVSDKKSLGLSESTVDDLPLWASSIIDSSEDVDVLSISDDSSVHCDSDDVLKPDSPTSVNDAQKRKTAGSEEVPETAEFFKVSDDVNTVEGESNCFSDDEPR